MRFLRKITAIIVIPRNEVSLQETPQRKLSFLSSCSRKSLVPRDDKNENNIFDYILDYIQ
jgi:hypothetical protein